MKLWISGRIDYDIENVFFGDVLHSVENNVNSLIKDKDYGNVINSWDIIMIIFKECRPDSEIFKFNSKDKETDIEVCVDYENFKNADLDKGKILFLNALLYSIEKMKTHKKLKNFDFEDFMKDINTIKKQIEI